MFGKMFTALLLMTTFHAYATPFETCPSKAYLFQSTPVQVYGVNLVSGNTQLIQGNTGINGNINGVGFDFDDRYIYGYDTTNKRIVRLGDDFQAYGINTTGLPTDYTFYVGDVYNHHYYLYRQGKGMFKIDLSPLDKNANATVVVKQISNKATVNLTDFAFHPGDGALYGIDNNSGGLYRFDASTGVETYIGDTGETGTFGAGYFDVNGYYYVSRNQDGQIYRIDLSKQNNIDNGIVPAVKFADGPSSNQNDGARCANAPIIDEDSQIDFGDAPDSYKTTLASNGPRHELDGVTWLGRTEPDGEQDGQVSPLSDNMSGLEDENGVAFVAAVESGLNTIVAIQASTAGYLSTWIDWNQDGDFDDANEKMFSDERMDAGQNVLFFTVPADAIVGSTWSRFRFSQQAGLNYFGGATSGEVEDHPLTVISEGTTVRHFPNEAGYATVAYEDNWPHSADYDMNDVVMSYRVTEIVKDGHVTQIKIQGYLAAYGASYHNGFAIRLGGVQRADIDESLTKQLHNNQFIANSGLESDSTEAIFIISDDLRNNWESNCPYYRTEANCKDPIMFTFTLHIALNPGTDTSSLMAMPYDPFIFATPGYYHGEEVTFQPGRKWEVHLPDHTPTEQFDGVNLFNSGVDASSPEQGVYFKNTDNLPWALLVTDTWQWPLERTDLVNAFPRFANYAETAGAESQNWFLKKNANNALCYQP
jgi:LruC domain-containing protein